MELNKVFCIGMFKTGTKSFGTAMRILGYNVLDRPWFILNDNWYKNPASWPHYYNQIKECALQYDTFSDAPWMFVYEQCDKWFPGSKFILTLRKDAETVAKSDLWQWRNKKVKPTIKEFIDRYTNNNFRIRNYFRDKNNLLEMCFENGDGWEKLCKFLNKPIPKKPFPHTNKSRRKR